jgi:hypothetical protein
LLLICAVRPCQALRVEVCSPRPGTCLWWSGVFCERFRRPCRRLVGGKVVGLCVALCPFCARAPSLISVHDPGWFLIGDMMFDGG